MSRSLSRYLKSLRKFTTLTDEQRIAYIDRPFKDFTRKSPLNFKRTISLIVGLLRKSLAIELFDFFKATDLDVVTKSAISQRRKSIKPAFFKDFFELSGNQFYRCFKNYKRWKGFLLFAVDGTGQMLPDESWIGEYLGFHRNRYNSVPSTRILFTFDILNKVIRRADFHTQKSGEIVNAYPNVSTLPVKSISIYDRGFNGNGLPYLHLRHGSHCIIRLPTKRSPTIQNFILSGQKEMLITLKLQGRALKTLRELELNPVINTPLSVRFIRVDLPTGEVEVLMTTITDCRKYPPELFDDLYDSRWGVETSIFILKSFLQMAQFSAYTLPGVEQDLWSTFWMFNVQSTIMHSAEDEVKVIYQNRKYNYQINRNVTAGILKRYIADLFTDSIRRWANMIKELQKNFISHLEPIRPRPNRERVKKQRWGNSRHYYESNYRRSM
jgi:hypothetical protein